MKSEFEELMGEGVEDAIDAGGGGEFTIGGKKFRGDVNFFDGERELMGEGGGFVGTYSATIIAGLTQFRDKFPHPLERSLDGKRILVDRRELRIVKAIVDSASLTLHLENPSKEK